MIHIVFNESDVKVLKDAILLDKSLEGEVIQVKDEFAVGPINDLYENAGMDPRKQWWREILEGGDYDGKVDKGEVDDPNTIRELIKKMGNIEVVTWIWVAQNKHDVSGYYWLLHYLKEFQGRIYLLFLHNLPFINEKGNIFYPSWLSEIPAKEFLKAKKLACKISPSEFEVDTDEWIKLASEKKGVRLLEGGKKLVQEEYDFYDTELKKYITKDWQKPSRIIHHFLSKSKHTTGDAYLLWRLKSLLASGDYDVQGNIAGMKDFEIKTRSNE